MSEGSKIYDRFERVSYNSGENTIFFDQVVDDSLFATVKTADQGVGQKLERMYDVRHCQNRLSVILFDNNIIRFVRIFAPYGQGN